MRIRVLATLLLLLTMAGCGPLFEKPRAQVHDVQVTSLTFAGIGFDVHFLIDNPNLIGLDLAKLSYQLDVDGHRFAAGGANRALHLPPQGRGQLTLPVSFKFVELAQSLRSLFTKKTVPVAMATRLGFGTPLGVLEIPLSYRGTLPVPQLPSLSFGRADLGHLSLSGTTVSLTLLVRNNNRFPLPLGPLQYALAINGAPILHATAQPGKLGPGATLPLTIAAPLDFLRLGTSLYRALQSRTATVTLDGNLDLSGYAMPVHLQTTLR